MERWAMGCVVGFRWVIIWVRSSEGRARRERGCGGEGGIVVGVVRWSAFLGIGRARGGAEMGGIK